MRTPVHSVVVGVDGGPSALAAVGVASAEAACRRAALHIVHADGWSVSPQYDIRALHSAPEDAGEVLAEAAGVAALRYPELAITTEVAPGPSAVAMLAASRGAALTVVGSRGLGGFAGRQLGSTAGQVVMYGGSPVLVVRGVRSPRGPVLATIDARHPSPQVLTFAFREAKLRNAELRLLFGWSLAAGETLPAGERRAARSLAKALDRWAAAFPDVKTVGEEQYTTDLPRTLVHASSSAALMIVGSHRRDDLAGVVLGPPAFALVHQAACPVVVVHPDDRTAVG